MAAGTLRTRRGKAFGLCDVRPGALAAAAFLASPPLAAAAFFVSPALAAMVFLAFPARAGAAADAPIRVVTSIPPLAMLVSELGGARVEVRSILGPGADPHLFEPRPSDAVAVSQARVVVSMGSSIDDWLGDAITPSAGAIVVLLDAGSAGDAHDEDAKGDREGEHHDHGGERDPHVWLDPLWVRDHALGPITRALMQADAAHGPQYAVTSRTMSEKLTDLDADVRETLSRADTKTFLAWHPAWAHFASRFGLHAITALGESEGREPSLKAMIHAVRAARAAGVHAILVEPQVDPRHPSVLAGELGVPLVTVDSLGNPAAPGRSTYGDLLRFNARAFRRALAVEKPVSAARSSPAAR